MLPRDYHINTYFRKDLLSQDEIAAQELLWEAQKVMIQMCCCLSCLELLNDSYKTLLLGKVIASGSF